MLAVTLPENELLSLLPDDLSISLINGPRLCVVAGPVAAVAAFESTADRSGDHQSPRSECPCVPLENA